MSGPLRELTDGLYAMYGGALPSAFSIFLLYMTQLIEWFGYIMVAIFSITLRKTILAQTRFGGLLSFVVFVLTYTAMQFINLGIYAVFSFASKYVDSINEMISSDTFNSVVYFEIISNYVIIAIVLWVVYITIFYLASSKLVDKRVDL
jgi:hypothetical protein